MIKKTEINEILQWSGIASFMSMYVPDNEPGDYVLKHFGVEE